MSQLKVSQEILEIYGVIAEDGSTGDDAVVDFVNGRYMAMSNAKQETEEMMIRCKALYKVSMDAIHAENTFKAPYRSARHFALVQSWIDEYVENFPEASLRASNFNDTNASNKAKVIEQAIKTIEEDSDAKTEKTSALEDAAKIGTGILYEYYCKEGKTLRSEYVDALQFFIDDDKRATTLAKARDCCWVRTIPYSTFKEDYSEFPEAKNVKPAMLEEGSVGTSVRSIDVNSQEFTDNPNQAVVLIVDYFNSELDTHYTIANNQLVNSEKTDKMLPFSVYKYIPNNDSFWGTGVIQMTAPEVFAIDNLTQLAFMNAKLSLQGTILMDKSVMTSNNMKVQTGAVYPLKNLKGRSASSVVQKMTFGGIDSDFFNMNKVFMDQIMVVSQIDVRALSAPSNQLATNTNAKKEALFKRVRTVIKRTLWNTEKHRMAIMVHLFKKYVVSANKNFSVDGYYVANNLGEENSDIKFISEAGSQGSFRATKHNTNVDVKITIIDANKKASNSQEDQMKLLKFFELTASVAKHSPEAVKDVNWTAFLAEGADAFGIDKKKFINDYGAESVDIIAEEHNQILSGGYIEFPAKEDYKTSKAHLAEHVSFARKNKELTVEQRTAINAHIADTVNNMKKMKEQEALGVQATEEGVAIPENALAETGSGNLSQK